MLERIAITIPIFPVKRNNPLLSEHMKIWLWNTSPWLWAALGGILIGLNAPGWHTQLVGLVAHLPVMLMLEQVQKRHNSFGKRLLLAILLCWGVGRHGVTRDQRSVGWRLRTLRV